MLMPCPSSLRHINFGVGKPSALHVRVMFWFSRTATDDCVLLPSRILGGTVTTPVQVKVYSNKRAILPSSATITNMNTLYAILDLLAKFIYSVKRSPSELTTLMLA
jgi:hypothetical protein